MSTQPPRASAAGLGRPLLVALAILATLAVNGLAVSLPLFGRDTGEISDLYASRFTPAGYVFAIWSLIYTGLIAYAVWQALPAQRGDARVRSLDLPLLINCAANSLWLVFWHRLSIPATVPVMLVILGSLIVIHNRLGIGRLAPKSLGERWCARATFSVYLGWISVATVANVSILLIHLGWDGWPLSPETWAVLLVAVAGVLAWLMVLRRGDALYPLVIAWAAWGIANKQADAATVVLAAQLVTAAALAASLVAAWRSRSRPAGALGAG